MPQGAAMPDIKPIVPIAAVCLLTLLVAGCGSDQGGSPSSQPQPPAPQSSAPPSSAQPSASAQPAAANDANAGGADAAAPADSVPADAEAANPDGQQDNYYGQPAPQAGTQDDPQAQWKSQRDGAAPAG
jgi:hypothetical protein